jgi:hypothetical protein|tara:strand:- start:163 stop:354 length:192 start_codon:yes stop_codon:yes gene_type:complete
MKVGDLVVIRSESLKVTERKLGIVIEIKPHPFLPQNGKLCKVQWPNHVNELMCSWLEVINESR